MADRLENVIVRIEVLPAGHGDCLWIDVLDRPSPWRAVIDGGTSGTYKHLRARLESLPPELRHIDLFVVTHVDADHIGGSIKLVERMDEHGATFGDIWFNAYEHLAFPGRKRGPKQGEALSAILSGGKTDRPLPWNEAFHHRAVVTPGNGKYRTLHLTEGIDVVLLGPRPEDLDPLREVWDKEIADARAGRPNVETDGPGGTKRGVKSPVPDPAQSLESLAVATPEDGAVANGSSIALLLRVGQGEGRRSILLTGDTHPQPLQAALWQLADDEGLRVHADMFKLPHHGSQANTTSELLGLVDTEHYVVSTNGAYFGHPDPAALARLALFGSPQATIWFNYSSPRVGWFCDRCAVLGRPTQIATTDAGGITIEL